jgi:hypothetical protein
MDGYLSCKQVPIVLEGLWLQFEHFYARRVGIFACNFNLTHQRIACDDYLSDLEQNKIVHAMFDSVMDNRNLGYWHIGQVYNKQAHFATDTVPTTTWT